AGIRDGHVTGVQTCALPISLSARGSGPEGVPEYRANTPARVATRTPDPPRAPILEPITQFRPEREPAQWPPLHSAADAPLGGERSEERRVGKEQRRRGAGDV